MSVSHVPESQSQDLESQGPVVSGLEVLILDYVIEMCALEEKKSIFVNSIIEPYSRPIKEIKKI